MDGGRVDGADGCKDALENEVEGLDLTCGKGVVESEDGCVKGGVFDQQALRDERDHDRALIVVGVDGLEVLFPEPPVGRGGGDAVLCHEVALRVDGPRPVGLDDKDGLKELCHDVKEGDGEGGEGVKDLADKRAADVDALEGAHGFGEDDSGRVELLEVFLVVPFLVCRELEPAVADDERCARARGGDGADLLGDCVEVFRDKDGAVRVWVWAADRGEPGVPLSVWEKQEGLVPLEVVPLRIDQGDSNPT